MGERPSIHEQYERERQMARLRRRQHGADTTLDDAEERHDAIWNWVWNTRFAAPFVVAALMGGVGARDAQTGLIVNLVGAGLSIVIALLIGDLVGRITGPFVERASTKTEHGVLMLGGAMLALTGLGVGAGVALTGLFLIFWPTLWTALAHAVMQNTDFSKLKAHQQRESEAPDFIIE